jgi:hypothetical protein
MVPTGLDVTPSCSPIIVSSQGIDDAYPDFVPRDEMRKAFANGATHMLFWRLIGDKFVCRGDYVLPERVRALRQSRGDSKSYTSESEEYVFDANGEGPIAKAFRTRTEVVIEGAATSSVFKRRELAEEFGVGNIHFVPTEDGVRGQRDARRTRRAHARRRLHTHAARTHAPRRPSSAAGARVRLGQHCGQDQPLFVSAHTAAAVGEC